MKNSLIKILICFPLFVTTLYNSRAQSLNSPIELYFDEMAQARQLNGNILLAEKGQVVTARSFGYADFETHKRNTLDTRFNLASISKVFTSTAILQLRDKGKLSLDDHLTKFFPDFIFPEVTVRHLLTHTSGLPDFDVFNTIAKKKPGKVIRNEDLLPELKNWKPELDVKPGDRYQYCNLGYDLLALVIEKVSGLSLAAYLEGYIFKPAGMRNTYLSIYPDHFFYRDKACAKMHYQLHPYYDSTYVHADSSAQQERIQFANYTCAGLVGSSGIISTTEDLLRFDRAFFEGRLLKPGTIQEALTPLKLNSGEIFYDDHMDTMLGEGKMAIGLGWTIFEQPGYGKSVGHGGFLYGNATFYFHNLKKEQTIIAFDNTAGSEFGRIVTSSLYLLNGKEPFEIRHHHSLAFVYGSTLVKQGADAAATALNAFKSDTAHYYVSEWEFNQLGGSLLYGSSFDTHQALALEVFKINTLLFPDSFNTYDSYAEGLRVTGKKHEAIRMYKKSIALNPNNEDGKRALEELLKN